MNNVLKIEKKTTSRVIYNGIIVFLIVLIVPRLFLNFFKEYVEYKKNHMWQEIALKKDDFQSNLLAAKECLFVKNFDKSEKYAKRALELSKNVKESNICKEIILYCVTRRSIKE